MVNKENIEKYIEEKWIISQTHPTLPLTIYNYSQATQFERKWDEITLACRGLILDADGKIVARPFAKFFNWEEIKDHPEFPASKFAMPYEVFDKEDGSLGIGIFYKGEFVIATRGSFTSDQAIRAAKILKKYDISEAANFSAMTFLFEIIYPENRIVVDYMGEEKLVLLGIVETATGKELEYDQVKRVAEKMGMPVVKRWEDNLSFEKIKSLNIENREGVVVKFSWGRMKIKFEDYCALHRILTNCSSYDIWENLRTFGELPKELFEKVPDEFYGWVRETRDKILENFEFYSNLCQREFELIDSSLENVSAEEYDKAFAKKVEKHRLKGFLFSLKKMKYLQGRGTVKEEVVRRNYSAPVTWETLSKLSLQSKDEIEIAAEETKWVLSVKRERPETDEELREKIRKAHEAAIWKEIKPEYEKPFSDSDG